MSDSNRWGREAYPERYRDDVNRSIEFAGVDMDMFARGKVDDIADKLKSHSSVPTQVARVLDIGCGIGTMHPMLRARVGELCGSDVSGEAIEEARHANPGIEYRTQSGTTLPFEDDTFDACTTVCVMHHVPQDEWGRFVAEAFRVTRPGGLFTVYEHNPINPLTRVAVWRCPFDHDAVLLRPRRTKELLRAAGFEIVESRYLFFAPFDAAWARRIDDFLHWLPLGAQYVVCARKPS
ncbi:MAG: class I SAM-dependent methyltransferase [Xanthomonadales bacterium]|nr:class I SAM-dependent methyltransferase [Xanthomonadales bacterium]